MKKIILFVFMIISSRAYSGEYLGEFCFGQNDSSIGLSLLMRIGVEHLGDSHFLFSGRLSLISDSSVINSNQSIFGNGEIIDDTFQLIFVSTTTSGGNNINIRSVQRAAILNVDSLSGLLVSEDIDPIIITKMKCP